jgi:hypothetical protein
MWLAAAMGEAAAQAETVVPTDTECSSGGTGLGDDGDAQLLARDPVRGGVDEGPDGGDAQRADDLEEEIRAPTQWERSIDVVAGQPGEEVLVAPQPRTSRPPRGGGRGRRRGRRRSPPTWRFTSACMGTSWRRPAGSYSVTSSAGMTPRSANVDSSHHSWFSTVQARVGGLDVPRLVAEEERELLLGHRGVGAEGHEHRDLRGPPRQRLVDGGEQLAHGTARVAVGDHHGHRLAVEVHGPQGVHDVGVQPPRG